MEHRFPSPPSLSYLSPSPSLTISPYLSPLSNPLSPFPCPSLSLSLPPSRSLSPSLPPYLCLPPLSLGKVKCGLYQGRGA